MAIDADPANVSAARQKLSAAGLYGVRVSVLHGDPGQTHFPKFFANLVVSGRSVQDGPAVVDAAEAPRLQRPYGGVACFGQPGAMQVAVRGPLENAGEWTHLYADASNTVCSADEIKGPLSVLWYRDVDLELPVRDRRLPVHRDPLRRRPAVPLGLLTCPLARLVRRPGRRDRREREERGRDPVEPVVGPGLLVAHRRQHALWPGRPRRSM